MKKSLPGQLSDVDLRLLRVFRTVVDSGCTKLGLANWVQEIVTGGIILLAVIVDRLRQRTDG